jgi:hypothetical protein
MTVFCFLLLSDANQTMFYVLQLRAKFQDIDSQGGLTSGRRPVVKTIAESLPQHDEKHVVPTPLSVKGSKKKN